MHEVTAQPLNEVKLVNEPSEMEAFGASKQKF